MPNVTKIDNDGLTFFRQFYADFVVNELVGQTVSRILEILSPEKAKFKVLNHGDPWVTNVMFKYTPYENTPVSLR